MIVIRTNPLFFFALFHGQGKLLVPLLKWWQNFNDAVKIYNTAIRTFPAVLFSGMFGFKEKGFFEAEAAAEKAPSVKF